MRKFAPAVLNPNAACPWPETTTEGIQYQRADPPDAAGSNIVPDSMTVGVPVPTGTLSSYQRAASRSPVDVPLPFESTAILCAVHRLPFRMCAAYNRSSSASSPMLLPRAGTHASPAEPPAHCTGKDVVLTVIRIFPEMLGVPPGSLIRRITRVPKLRLLGPIM
jgi:hypothetical protein